MGGPSSFGALRSLWGNGRAHAPRADLEEIQTGIFNTIATTYSQQMVH